MPTFGTASKASLAEAHPLLQKLFTEVIKEIDCKVLDAQRGKAAQEEAFRKGNSKAHFGSSAHNYSPAVALDVVPWPLDWKDVESFRKLAAVVKRKAKELDIPITWGGDWKTLVDMPHYELRPWRDWAKKSKLYEGKKGSAKGKLLDAVTAAAAAKTLPPKTTATVVQTSEVSPGAPPTVTPIPTSALPPAAPGGGLNRLWLVLFSILAALASGIGALFTHGGPHG